MLVGQAAIYLAANVLSAVFGLFNSSFFTRVFDPADLGDFYLCMAFVALVTTLHTTWLKLLIMREQARGDGTDVRGLVLAGLGFGVVFAPLSYPAARLVGLGPASALASVSLAACISLFDTGQELLRAQMNARKVMQGTLIRAVLVSVFGVLVGIKGGSGVILIVTSTIAYLVAAIFSSRATWRGVDFQIEWNRVFRLFREGLPLTLSLFLLALSTNIDRFLIAHLSGTGAAGDYSAGVDLVRQTLIIPAVSVASAFVPMTVQILANRGERAAVANLERCVELLLATTLPACLGFAVVAPHIADVILGPSFRATARAVMPIVAISVAFQILTQQYLHIGFLLSKRNFYYLLNTGSIIIFNICLSLVLIDNFGSIGAAWARLAAEVFGFLSAAVLAKHAFPMPLFSVRRAQIVVVCAMIMMIGVHLVDVQLPQDGGILPLVVLLPFGTVFYAGLCLIANVLGCRERLAAWLRHYWPVTSKPQP